MSNLYDELEFPPKAEFLGSDEFKNYKVDIAHWGALSTQFQRIFRQVHARRSAAVLLVYGPQGSGKSLFCKRLLEDYEKTKAPGGARPNLSENLWHTLVATNDPEETKIKQATDDAILKKVDDPNTKWLEDLRSWAKQDTKHRVRIFLFDNAARDSMLRPWTELGPTEFAAASQVGPDALLTTVAQRIDALCRSDFERSILVLFSNDRLWLETLQKKLDTWWDKLATLVDLPVPPASDLERIVRINTNRLNRFSYWYCLDAATSTSRKDVRAVLMGAKGFTDSFDAVGKALATNSRRLGRPANRNVFTFVTLCMEPATVNEFLNAREFFAKGSNADAKTPKILHENTARHIGLWEMWGPWASLIPKEPPTGSGYLRRARMLESEFMFQWVTLDLNATYALLSPPAANDLGEKIVQLFKHRPTSADATEHRKLCAELDSAIAQEPFARAEVDKFEQKFVDLGQRRSVEYENAIKQRVGSDKYGKGLVAYSRLRPDITQEQYQICALTSAPSDDEKALLEALRRTAHTIEFTAFVSGGDKELEEYLQKKIEAYAAMLESV